MQRGFRLPTEGTGKSLNPDRSNCHIGSGGRKPARSGCCRRAGRQRSSGEDTITKTALTFCFLALTTFAADWPTFLGPNRDSTSPETGLLNSWPESGLNVVWSRDIGTGYSAPSVIDGMVVLFHREGNVARWPPMNRMNRGVVWPVRLVAHREKPPDCRGCCREIIFG